MGPGGAARAEREGLRLVEGDRFGTHFVVLGQLGQGGMGSVLQVRDLRDGACRALKVMHASIAADGDLRDRFEREATVLEGLDSPHLVRTLEAGIDEATGTPYLLMEQLDGEDLGARLRRGPIPTVEAIAILTELASALDATHAAGIVHRDLKPENLFLARGPEGDVTLKVLDFGVAKVLVESGASLHSTRTLGSPLYMSPEQLEGEATIDGRSDVYALGHVAYAVLVGEAYWAAQWRRARGVFPVLLQVMRGAVELPSERVAGSGVSLPPGFDAWFLRATALAPDDRFDTAGEAVAALRSGTGRHGAPVVRRAPLPSGARRPVWPWVAVAAVALAAVALLGWSRSPKASAAASTPAAPLRVAEAGLAPPEEVPARDPTADPVKPPSTRAANVEDRAPGSSTPRRRNASEPTQRVGARPVVSADLGIPAASAPASAPRAASTSYDPTDVR